MLTDGWSGTAAVSNSSYSLTRTSCDECWGCVCWIGSIVLQSGEAAGMSLGIHEVRYWNFAHFQSYPLRLLSFLPERLRFLRCCFHEVDFSFRLCVHSHSKTISNFPWDSWRAWCGAAGVVAIPCRLGNRSKRLLLWAERKISHCLPSVSVFSALSRCTNTNVDSFGNSRKCILTFEMRN
jgi:hypothetical protein